MIKQLLLRTSLFLFIPLSSFGQYCDFLQGISPAFEFDIPIGATVTSVNVSITNYSSDGGHISARIRSFQDLETVRIFENGEYQVLASPLSGPSIQDLQIESGIDYFCGLIGDHVSFDWQVNIEATGIDGTLINYSGPLTDNLAIPDNLGSVYNGNSFVSGSMDLTLTGEGILLYTDTDFDEFGGFSSPTILACSEFCQFGYSSNNLDCDDYNPDINPDQTEIPYNGLDDDCDPTTLDDDLDEDGFIAANECDDTNPDINPDQSEVPYNGLDDDCDPTTLDDDLDEDGFIAANECDDTNPDINPAQIEIPNNGIDEDCDGSDLIITSIEDFINIITLYPNPTSRYINIGFDNNTQISTELFNISGDRILSTQNSLRIDLNDFSNGVYFLKIYTPNGHQIIRKILLEK